MYIAIEGAIGVGKTTLSRLLSSRFQADLLLEVFEENPFLADFYADRDAYAFQTQIFFLLSRYHQQQGVTKAFEANNSLIADYTWQTSGSWDWFVRGSYYYRDKTTADIDNDPNVTIDAYGLLDASFGIDNGNWRIYLWGKNLTDEFYVTRIFDTPSGGTGYSQYLSPNSERRYGIAIQFGM